MVEKIMVTNKSTDYRNATTGVFEDNPLASVFFSAGNIQTIQNGIRAGVYEKSNGLYVIPNQNINNLKISKNESVKEAIDNVAKKLGVSKNVIMSILEHEYENVGKRIK